MPNDVAFRFIGPAGRPGPCAWGVPARRGKVELANIKMELVHILIVALLVAPRDAKKQKQLEIITQVYSIHRKLIAITFHTAIGIICTQLTTNCDQSHSLPDIHSPSQMTAQCSQNQETP